MHGVIRISYIAVDVKIGGSSGSNSLKDKNLIFRHFLVQRIFDNRTLDNPTVLKSDTFFWKPLQQQSIEKLFENPTIRDPKRFLLQMQVYDYRIFSVCNKQNL